MKQLIKAAIVYNAELPAAEYLEQHLQENAFAELTSLQLRSVGFVAFESGLHTSLFPGGVAFKVRIDEKIIPASALEQEVERMALETLQMTGRKPGKKERKELKDAALLSLAARAFTRTAIVTCFYEYSTHYLIVPTTSKKLSDIITSALVHAVASMKTTTINVSGIKKGLTARMTKWLENDDEAFGEFIPSGNAALAVEKRRLTVKMGNLQAAKEGLQEVISKGFEVTSLGFNHIDTGVEFRLTDGFQFKGITFMHDPAEGDDLFAAEAAIEVAELSEVITELCDMMGYEPPEDEVEDAPGGESAASSAPEVDRYDEAVTLVCADGKASISYIQRKLRIGYNTAARLLETMEKNGIVSAMDGSGMRQVLKGAAE
jgi:recombination associated protein RdgC